MSNVFLDYYKVHGISPVRQHIDESDRHVARRTALYRQLGLAAPAWRGADVLEVGPGGGYNAVVTAGLGPRRYVLLEPNSTGYGELVAMLERFGRGNVEARQLKLEDAPADEDFDIVLCENLIPGLDNKWPLLRHLDARVRPGGVLVITCQDRLSMFFESVRRYIAVELVHGIADFAAQVSLLADVFRSHTATLTGMSRPVEDWVMDNLVAPPLFNIDDYFSVADALHQFGNDYYFYHLAPALLPDLRWYKQLPAEPAAWNAYFLDQFAQLRHNLIDYRTASGPRPPAANDALEADCLAFARLVRKHWLEPSATDRDAACALLDKIGEQLAGNPTAHAACVEIGRLFAAGRFRPPAVAGELPAFAAAFGRGVQYLSLVKAGRLADTVRHPADEKGRQPR